MTFPQGIDNRPELQTQIVIGTRKIFLSAFSLKNLKNIYIFIYYLGVDTWLFFARVSIKCKMIEALRRFSKMIPRWSDKKETTNYRSESIRSQRRTGNKVLSYTAPPLLLFEEVTSRTIPDDFSHETHVYIHRLDRTYISILSWARRNCRRAFVSCHRHWLKQGLVSPSTLITPSQPNLQIHPLSLSTRLNNSICTCCFIGRHHGYFFNSTLRREIRRINLPVTLGHPTAYGKRSVEFFLPRFIPSCPTAKWDLPRFGNYTV